MLCLKPLIQPALLSNILAPTFLSLPGSKYYKQGGNLNQIQSQISKRETIPKKGKKEKA